MLLQISVVMSEGNLLFKHTIALQPELHMTSPLTTMSEESEAEVRVTFNHKSLIDEAHVLHKLLADKLFVLHALSNHPIHHSCHHYFC